MRITGSLAPLCAAALIILSAPAPAAGDEWREAFDRAEALSGEGLYGEAEAEYKKVINMSPRFAPAYNSLGLIYSYDIERIRDAIVHFMTAVKLDPSYTEAYHNLGVLSYKTSSWDKAVEFLGEAIRTDPSYHRAYYIMGWTYLMGLRDPDEAVVNFEKAVELNPGHPEAHLGLGMAYIEAGKIVFVLEPITRLRELRREDLAVVLENMIRKPYDPDDTVDETPIEMDFVVERPPRGSVSLVGTGTAAAGDEAPSVSSGEGRISMSGTLSLKITGKGQEDMTYEAGEGAQ